MAKVARCGSWVCFLAAVIAFDGLSWLGDVGSNPGHLINWIVIFMCLGLLGRRLEQWCRLRSGDKQYLQGYSRRDEN